MRRQVVTTVYNNGRPCVGNLKYIRKTQVKDFDFFQIHRVLKCHISHIKMFEVIFGQK